MAHDRPQFICSSCGHEEPRWLGRCPTCGMWNTFMEGSPRGKGKPGSRGGKKTDKMGSSAVLLSSVNSDQEGRIDTTYSELNRVLGGGLMKGGTVLLGGEPGIGKSTLMLQAAAAIGDKHTTLYVSGEESPAQIKQRAERIGVDASHIHIFGETELNAVLECLKSLNPQFVVIDSIQTLYVSELGAVPGTVNQMKYCCHELTEWVRLKSSCLLFVAHITKEGMIAGPKVIEHMVDTVLYFDQAEGDLRFLRAAKNRFGSVDEIGLFSMGEGGLVQVGEPSTRFLVRRTGTLPAGVVVAPVYEGSRVLLVEIQALVVPAKGGISRVFSDRIDSGRVSRISAVLEKHAGLSYSDQDIYVNVAGGIRITEVGIELPLAFALYSARTGIPFPEGAVIAGEVSLAGEVRPVPHLRRRFRTAKELGFPLCIGPTGWAHEEEDLEESWVGVSTVTESIRKVFNAVPER